MYECLKENVLGFLYAFVSQEVILSWFLPRNYESQDSLKPRAMKEGYQESLESGKYNFD